MPDYYETLGVERGASAEEIKKGYRKKAVKYHPDKNPDDNAAEQKFKDAAEAYEVLSDPQKRSQYDQFGRVDTNGGFGGGGGFEFDLSDALRTFMSGFGGFGGFDDIFGGAGGRARGARGSDQRVTIKLSLEEIATGIEKKIKIKRFERCDTCDGSGAAEGSDVVTCPQCRGAGEVRQVQRTLLGQMVNIQPCRNCGGSGQVIKRPCRSCHSDGRIKQTREIKIDIPAGVASGNYMTLTGEGNHGVRGARAGDLIVLFDEQSHYLLTRHGRDVLLTVLVSYSEAALGTTVTVPTLDGEAKLKLPPGIQSGQVLRMRGKGFHELRGRGVGDQLAKIQLVSPTNLTREQKAAFENLQKNEPDISDHDRFEKFRG